MLLLLGMLLLSRPCVLRLLLSVGGLHVVLAIVPAAQKVSHKTRHASNCSLWIHGTPLPPLAPSASKSQKKFGMRAFAALCVLLVTAGALFEDEVDAAETFVPGSSARVVVTAQDTVLGPRWRFGVLDGLRDAVVRPARVFLLSGEGQLSVLDAATGLLIWNGFDGFRGPSTPDSLDVDGDGTSDVPVVQSSELTVRSGATGTTVWNKRLDEAVTRAGLVTTGVEDGVLCAYGINASGVAAQCWGLASQEVTRRWDPFSPPLSAPLLHVFADATALTRDCKLSQFDGRRLSPFSGNVSDRLAALPEQFKKCRDTKKAHATIDTKSSETTVLFEDGTLTGMREERLVYRFDRMVDCDVESSFSQHHSNLFSENKKLILRSGVACVTQSEGDACFAMLIDGATGKVWRSVKLEQCLESDAAVRVLGNMVVVLYRTSFGHQLSVFELFESAPTHIRSRYIRYPLVTRTLTLSRTKVGLTTPVIAVMTKTHRLLSLPLYIFDQPMLMLHDGFFVSHAHRLVGIESVTSWPGQRESQTILEAKGADSFRIVLTPNGSFDSLPPSFPKGLLLAVIAALLAAVIVSHVLRGRSALNRRWYS